MNFTRSARPVGQCCYSFEERPRQVFVRDDLVIAVAAVPSGEPPLLDDRVEWLRFAGIRLAYFWFRGRTRGPGAWQVVTLRRERPRFGGSALWRPDSAWILVRCGEYPTRADASQVALHEVQAEVPGVQAPSAALPKHPAIHPFKYLVIGILCAFFALLGLVPLEGSVWVQVIPFLGFLLGMAGTYLLGVLRILIIRQRG